MFAQAARVSVTPCLLLLIACGSSLARAAEVRCTVSTPRNIVPRPVTLVVTPPNGAPWSVTVMVLPMMSAAQKRDAFIAQINASGHSAVADGPTQFSVQGVAPGTTVQWTDGGTCEALDKIVVPGAIGGTNEFSGFFEPFDTVHQPAIFTAGLVTDVGELVVTVSAAELNFQTEGPIICQALFQRLAPRAPQFGAQINFAGDRLEIYFDPAYTIVQGGVVLGTTSPSPGSGGTVRTNALPPNGNGDLNCDGQTNILDINAFVLAITNPAAYAAAYPNCNIMSGDMNGDGSVDILDINPFIAAVSGG